MPLILAGVLGILSILLIYFGMKKGKSANSNIEDRLSSFGAQNVQTLAEREQAEGFTSRVFRPMIKKWSSSLGSKSPASALDKTREKLAQAGNPSGMGPVEF